ncbi:MAG TPA: response regulator [Bacteroidia bacterium]|nr:response regulator [Bacteroidia bacterium]
MKLKILHLEDSPADAELVDRVLKKSNIDFETLVVSDEPEFIKALLEFAPDIVISDHSLPSFNSIEALHLVKKRDAKTPIILVTATMSEEFAANVMKQGAYDYILKDRLQRLPTAILNALEKSRFESEKEKYILETISSDALFKKAEKIAHFGIWESNLITGKVKWSDEMFEMFGYKKNEIEASRKNFLKAIHPEDKQRVENLLEGSVNSFNSFTIDFRVTGTGHLIKHIHSVVTVEKDEEGEPIRLIGFNQDATEEKELKIEKDKMMASILQRNNDLEQFTYIVSHNLRAPVANIIGLVGMLKEEKNDDSEKEKILTGLDASVSRLDTVILDMNQILQTRNKAGQKKGMVSFSELVEEVKHMIEDTIIKEKAEIITDFSEVDEIETLKVFMLSIFFNLILNSIKFHQKNSTPIVRITSYKVHNKIYITFKDNGMGIDLPNNSDKIFGLYNRFHREVDGKGMGLFMVKTQVEGLNGKVSVISQVDKGTVFTIEFET